MTDLSTTKPPIWFWIIAVVALIWNAMGVMAYLIQAFMTDEMIAALPEEQQAELLIDFPAWYTAAFALAVFCGALACFVLLLRKKLAFMLFLISFIAATIQQVYVLLTVEDLNPGRPILIIVVAAFLLWFTKIATTKGWLK